jgi:hypothetical protein
MDRVRGSGRLGFTVASRSIRNWIYTPRYYDPAIDERLEELEGTHDLVSTRR